MSRASSSVGIYHNSECATRLARVAAKSMSVVVLGSIYTKGAAPPVLFLYDEFDAASIRGPVVVVDTETVEPEMIRSLMPHCPPALCRLPRAIPRMLAAAKAHRELVIVDPLPGPSTTAHLMLMACETVVFPFDGREHALRLFLHLVSSWLEQYKPILKSHRPRIVIYADTEESAAAAIPAVSRSAAVVWGPISALLEHLESTSA